MYNKGENVKWDWGNGAASGKVEEHFQRDVERTIDGNTIKRKGSKDNPAYLIKQEDGQQVLKLESELKRG